MGALMNTVAWPELPYPEWKDTYATLHRWVQIVGKTRLAKSPWLNHCWQATFYATARGLSTSPIPDGHRVFAAEFDFVDHVLVLSASDGARARLPLRNESVSDFYGRFLFALRELGTSARIWDRPNEVADATPFSQDHVHRAYDRDAANRFFRAAVQADRVLKEFRARFIGKCSPVHFFWGSFDLAVTRFSGRRAPEHPGGVPALPNAVAREAYSHEVSSLGFWPGNEMAPFPAFYSYAYPAPPGFESARAGSAAAYFDPKLREFLLPYDAVRASRDPDAEILRFAEATYAAAADLGGWNRAELEESPYLRELQRYWPKTG